MDVAELGAAGLVVEVQTDREVVGFGTEVEDLAGLEMAQRVAADLELGLGNEAVVELEAGLVIEDQNAGEVVDLRTEAGLETEDQTGQEVVGLGTEASVELEAGLETEDRTAR